MANGMMLAGGKTAPGPGHFDLFEVEKPRIRNDTDVLFRVTSVGVCGTDLSLFRWTETAAKEFHPNFPLVTGHEMSGIVEEVGAAVTRLKPGDHITVNEHIFCGECDICAEGRTCICENRVVLGCHVNGAMTKYVVVREKNCFVLSENVPLYAGSLAEPLSVSVHALERVPAKAGDLAVVFGVGMIGLGVIFALKGAGATVIAAGLPHDKKRLALAEELGANSVVLDGDAAEIILDKVHALGKNWADLAYECSGSAAGLRTATEVIRPAGSICEVGIPGGDISLDVGGQITFKEKSIIGSRAFYHSTWPKTIELMGKHANLLDKFITHKLSLERFAETIPLMEKGEAIKAIICPNEG